MSATDKPQSTYEEIVAGLGLQLPADFELYSNQVLVGIYIKPAMSKGGIIFTDKTRDEDRWQGKVGAVIAAGPVAFKDDPSLNIYFNDQTAEPGDWIMYRVSDGFPVDINGIHCRLLDDVQIRAKLKDPTIIY